MKNAIKHLGVISQTATAGIFLRDIRQV